MMTIEYEQSLVETAVFLGVREDESQECAFHLAIDPLYEISDAELRQREFAPVYRDFFRKLGFDQLVAGLLAERPAVGEGVDRCVVREAARQKAESAELLVQQPVTGEGCPNKTLVIQICPQSFLDSERFASCMRRELLHVADMLDEAFGYEREAFHGAISFQNLQRDRYRVLWEIYVEGRLDGEGRGKRGAKEGLQQALDRVFTKSPDGAAINVFRRLFDASSLTHRLFMDWAREPSLLFGSSPDSRETVGLSTCPDSTRGPACGSVSQSELCQP